MGVNVRAWLPAECRIRDVAKVAGALLGNKVTRHLFNSSDSYYADVEGIKLKAGYDSICMLASMVLTLNPENPAAANIIKSDGNPYHMDYFFEYGPKGARGLYPACTASKIALCVGIVKCFGGRVDYCDADDKDVNLRVKPYPHTSAEDGEPWKKLQNRILAVKPLKQKDIDKYMPYASYGA